MGIKAPPPGEEEEEEGDDWVDDEVHSEDGEEDVDVEMS